MDQTDGNGVPLDDDQATESLDAPDSLLGESGSVGALSKIGSKGDTKDRAQGARDNMRSLQSQYAVATQNQADAYAQQRKTIQDATQRLLGMQVGPSDKEAAYRVSAAIANNDRGGSNVNSVSTAQADNLKAQREAEQAKNALIAQYTTQVPAAQIGQANAQINSLIQRMRLGQSDINNSAVQANKAENTAPKTTGTSVWDPQGGPQGTGGYTTDATLVQAQKDSAALKLKNGIALKSAAQKLNGTGPIDEDTLNFLADKGNLDPHALTGITRSPGIMMQIQRRMAERAQASGDTAASLIANQQFVANQKAVLKDFLGGGKTSVALNGINTSVKHMETFDQAVDALNNGSAMIPNEIANSIKTQLGLSSAPNNFDAIKGFVAGEIAKAVLPGGGGEREREELANSAKSALKPEFLKDVISKWKVLMAGKTDATKLQWDMATNGAHGDFYSHFLLPETRAALGIHAAPPPQVAPAQRPGQAPPQPPRYTPDQLAAAKKYGVTLPGT